MKPSSPKLENDNLFLPDLCAMQMVLVVIIIVELAAFVLVLAPMELAWQERWNRLGMISLYMQWCALGSCTVLCVLRPWLRRFSNIQVGTLSYLLILMVVVGVTELAYWLVYKPSNGANEGWHLQFMLRNLAIAVLIAGPILRYFFIQHQWRQKVQAENQARLQALQSRIRPHFLFNSMNTIASLIRQQPKQAEATVENLADLFRAVLSDAREQIPLSEELALCRRYLDIEALRLGERLQQQWQIDDLPSDALVAPLLLQPLLENAIYHGIEPLTEGGCIEISGQLEERRIVIRVRNPFDTAARRTRSRGNHLAQENIRQRLVALYGSRGHLAIEHSETHYLTTLYLPYKSKDENSDR